MGCEPIQLRAERDAALAEVERLKLENEQLRKSVDLGLNAKRRNCSSSLISYESSCGVVVVAGVSHPDGLRHPGLI